VALAELGGADAGVALTTSALAASHASGTASDRPILLSRLADELCRDHGRDGL
jgi:hypothetical protein